MGMSPGDKKDAESGKKVTEDGKKDVDLIQSAMGIFGRWQILICLWISLLKLPVAWHQLSIVFLAPPVDFWCQGPGGHNNVSVHHATGADACTWSVFNETSGLNVTEACDNWEYDKSTFSATIVTEWNLVCDRAQLANWAQTVFMFGVLLGNVLFGMAADTFGRKLPLIAAVVLQIVAGVAIAFVPWFEAFLVLRFLSALATGGTMITSFVICMEIVGGKWRTIVAVLYHVPFSIGHSLMGVIAYYLRDWHDYQLFISLPSLVLLAYWWTVPESPRWLLAVGKNDEAIAVLEKAAKDNKLEIQDMRQKLSPVIDQKNKQDIDKKANILDLFRTPNMRTKTLSIYFNWFVCGLCFFGLAQFMGRAGGNIFVNVGVSGLIEIPGGTLGIFLMTKIGRRNTLMLAQFVSGVACVLIMLVPQDGSVQWPKVTLAAIGILGMSISFPTVYLFSGELFPTVVRNVGVGSSSMCARVGSMAAPFIASLSLVSDYLPPLFFGLAPLIGSALCFLLPETADTELPETLEDGENFGKKKAVLVNENGTTNIAFTPDEIPM